MAFKNKSANQNLQTQRQMRRRWITWTRMVRYGINNFTRNAWLTTAATAVMTITLVIIFIAVLSRVLIGNTITAVQSQTDIPVALDPHATSEQVSIAKNKVQALSSVKSVSIVSMEDAKQDYIAANNPSPETLTAISNLPTSPFFPKMKIVPTDPNNITEIANAFKKDKDIVAVLHPDPRRAPKFTGESTKVIKTIGSWMGIAQTIGLVAGLVFVAISMLIIFNTIRMAIFNRKDEIEMMKLIGADKGFIRGPFVVEAEMYGFVAALFATALGIGLFLSVEPRLRTWGIATANIHEWLTTFWPVMLLAMIAIGVTIGVISSRLAVRRYLRV